MAATHDKDDRRLSGHLAAISCGVALASLLPVAAHQLGMLEHLPDPPGRLFDSDGITESPAAHPLGIPDSVLGIASYSATLALLYAARRRAPLPSALLKWKLGLDASAASANSVRQVVKFRRVCSWCTATAIATAAMVHFGRKALRD
jgi:uncharacterized membrane protein